MLEIAFAKERSPIADPSKCDYHQRTRKKPIKSHHAHWTSSFSTGINQAADAQKFANVYRVKDNDPALLSSQHSAFSTPTLAIMRSTQGKKTRIKTFSLLIWSAYSRLCSSSKTHGKCFAQQLNNVVSMKYSRWVESHIQWNKIFMILLAWWQWHPLSSRWYFIHYGSYIDFY